MAIQLDGAKLKAIRERQFLTQNQLAIIAGIRSETICRLERNQRKAEPRTVLRLAQALNVEPYHLQAGETNPQPVAARSGIFIGGER